MTVLGAQLVWHDESHLRSYISLSLAALLTVSLQDRAITCGTMLDKDMTVPFVQKAHPHKFYSRHIRLAMLPK